MFPYNFQSSCSSFNFTQNFNSQDIDILNSILFNLNEAERVLYVENGYSTSYTIFQPYSLPLQHYVNEMQGLVDLKIRKRSLTNTNGKVTILSSEKYQEELYKLSLIKHEIQVLCQERMFTKGTERFDEVNEEVLKLVRKAQSITKQLIHYNLNQLYV